MDEPPGSLAAALDLAKRGDASAAAGHIRRFSKQRLGIDFAELVLTTDNYSLNSVSGRGTLREPFRGADELFFKFHKEEAEDKGVREYYNSTLLEAAGFPVDVPVAASQDVDNAILYYRVKRCPRLADLAREADAAPVAPAELVHAQEELDRFLCDAYRESLRWEDPAEAAAESLHQLFYHRMVDGPESDAPGGRLKKFYIEGTFRFPGLDEALSWDEIRGLRWRINGVPYRLTLGEAFDRARAVLNPRALPAPCPVVTAHGDAHNANVWFEDGRLALFDPAFAGAHIPALLAEVKATFHNIFAHPNWLYHPRELPAGLRAEARLDGGTLEVSHTWAPTPIRAAFLRAKQDLLWKPLLHALAADERFAGTDWETYVRLALFCCPTLVMNLCASEAGHTPTSSLVGLSVAMMCASPPASATDRDVVSDFLAAVAPS